MVVVFDLYVIRFVIGQFGLYQVDVIRLLFFFDGVDVRFISYFLVLGTFNLRDVDRLLVFIERVNGLADILFGLHVAFFGIFHGDHGLYGLFNGLDFGLYGVDFLLNSGDFLLFRLYLRADVLLRGRRGSIVWFCCFFVRYIGDLVRFVGHFVRLFGDVFWLLVFFLGLNGSLFYLRRLRFYLLRFDLGLFGSILGDEGLASRYRGLLFFLVSCGLWVFSFAYGIGGFLFAIASFAGTSFRFLFAGDLGLYLRGHLANFLEFYHLLDGANIFYIMLFLRGCAGSKINYCERRGVLGTRYGVGVLLGHIHRLAIVVLNGGLGTLTLMTIGRIPRFGDLFRIEILLRGINLHGQQIGLELVYSFLRRLDIRGLVRYYSSFSSSIGIQGLYGVGGVGIVNGDFVQFVCVIGVGVCFFLIGVGIAGR